MPSGVSQLILLENISNGLPLFISLYYCFLTWFSNSETDVNTIDNILLYLILSVWEGKLEVQGLLLA
jgi:hypothetical protein